MPSTSTAHDAELSFTIRSYICIFLIILMSMWAMCFRGTQGGRRYSSENIFPVGHWLKMLRIYAKLISA